MTTCKICFTCKHWNILNKCELKNKKRYWNCKCLKWKDNTTQNLRKDILDYLAKNPPKYENYDHSLDSIRLLHRKALNCTDGFYTNDEKEYRRKFKIKLRRLYENQDND